LAVTLDDNSVRKFLNTEISLKHAAISANGQLGKSYKIKAVLVESAVQIVTGGTKWARANLWYDGNATEHYRFRVSPHYRDIARTAVDGFDLFLDPLDLWKYGAKTPGGSYEAFDPCDSVYPYGLWRMAKVSDFDALGSPNVVYSYNRKEHESGGIIHIPYVISVLPTMYLETIPKWNKVGNVDNVYASPFREDDSNTGMDDLFLPGFGYRDIANSAVGKVIASSLLNVLNAAEVITSVSGGGYYWAGDPRPLAPSYPYYYRHNLNGLSLVNVDLTIAKLAILETGTSFNQSTPNAPALISDSRMLIRCVRAQ